MSSIDVEDEEEEVSSLEDASPEGGGPPGGGPPAPREPPGPPGPPAPPGPLAKAALKTPCSSVAWSLVSLPLETSPLMRSSIFDLRSEGFVPLAWSLARLACSEESMSESAEDSVLIGGRDGAGRDFRLQFVLQPLQRRLIGRGGGRRDRGHEKLQGFAKSRKEDLATVDQRC